MREAVVQLVEQNIGSLVVVDWSGHPIGLLSERDVIRTAVTHPNVFDLEVAEAMTTNLITAQPDEDVRSVANTMTERRIRHLPVIEEGKLVGIISIGDVVKAQRDQYRGEVDTLQIQLGSGA
ncbi:MAG: CBS domain-containing protein [Anaerolineae bacterium]|nr:MAG: CBS domain-containing protein [Anaerolineae bacterium]